jgi:FKBP-type peptidyl-prolyl cis-trans isomerase 2
VQLRPEQAYGRRDPTALMEVERSDFPDDVAPGDRFEAETEEGDLIVLRVLDVTDEAVVIDTNHPLADQTVRFELQIVAVRPATPAELEAAAARLEQENLAAPEGDATPDSRHSPVVPLRRLLEGGRRRYESERKPGAPGSGEA